VTVVVNSGFGVTAAMSLAMSDTGLGNVRSVCL
jgi:hypothetical protein